MSVSTARLIPVRVVSALLAGAAGAAPAAGVATGLAVVDRLDTYLALVTYVPLHSL